jgi:molecular chaperone DnaK
MGTTQARELQPPTVLRVEQPKIEKKRSTAKTMLPPKGDVIIGIDLGTTFSCASIIENGQPRVIQSRWATNTIPSIVMIQPDGKPVIGWPAFKHQSKHPSNTIIGAKRLVGRPFHSPIVQEVRNRYAYEIAEGEDGESCVRVGGKSISLEEISSMILKEIRETASLHLKKPVNRAVITCPAYYNDRQREAVRHAGEMAGFHVERVLSEPTAAALHFGYGKIIAQRIVLVYDLGGGTFDVSLLNIEGDNYRVIATGGDTFLGGLDFDALLANYVAEQIVEKTMLDPREDQVAMHRLMEACEKAKRTLSEKNVAQVQIDHFVIAGHAAFPVSVELNRTVTDKLFEPLVAKTIEASLDVVKRASIDISKIDDVILVGGQTRTPIIRNRVREVFGKEPRRGLNPDEAVALGAAQFASTVDEEGVSPLKLVDALPMSIGVGLPGGRFKKIIERDARLPVQHTYKLQTTRDDQEEIEVLVFQGESERVEENELLGIVTVSKLPPGPRRSVTVLVTFEVTGDCVLNLTATEQKTGRSMHASMATKGTPQELLAKLGARQRRMASRVEKPQLGIWAWVQSLFRTKSS